MGTVAVIGLCVVSFAAGGLVTVGSQKLTALAKKGNDAIQEETSEAGEAIKEKLKK